MQVVIDVATFFLGFGTGGVTVLVAEVFLLSRVVKGWLPHGVFDLFRGRGSA